MDFSEVKSVDCDECKHYVWYYDHCEKWNCKVDPREVHNCYVKRDTPIRDMMVNPTVLIVDHPYAAPTKDNCINDGD